MKNKGRVSLVVLLSVLIVIVTGLLASASPATAMWIIREDYDTYEERTCRNGMIFSGIWPYGAYPSYEGPKWFDWELDPFGRPWDSRSVSVRHPDGSTEPWTPSSVASGPKVEDPIEGLEFVSNFWIVRWDDDLYPDIPIGDEIPFEEIVEVTVRLSSDWDSEQEPGISFTAGSYMGQATGCVIEDSLPAPSMYIQCSEPISDSVASPVINFPGEINLVDLDVLVDVTNALSQTISARVTSPAGESATLFSDRYVENDFSLERIYDDDLPLGADSFNEYYLPTQSLTAFDASSANGEWELTLTRGEGEPYPDGLSSWCVIATGYRTVRYAAGRIQAIENAGSVRIGVELSEPSTMTTTVGYAALPGRDSNQHPQNGTLVFAPGEESKSFAIQITDDLRQEANESVRLTLSNPGNQYGVGTPAEATLAVVDNDHNLFIPSIISARGEQPQVNPLTNPGFESGPVSWTEFSLLGYPLIYHRSDLPITPHDGDWAAWLGGLDDEISYVAQQVTVPAGSPVLSYWHYIVSPDICGYDFGGVVVNSTVVVDVYDLCEETNTNGWVRHTVDLSAYAGQSIELQIRAETDFSLVSNLFVDDVSFESPTALPQGPGSNISQELPNVALQKPPIVAPLEHHSEPAEERLLHGVAQSP